MPIAGARILRTNSARICVIVVATLAASTGTMIAQQPAWTRMTIAVTDMTGAPIPKAEIKIMSPEDGRLLEFTADSLGIANLDLSPGEYQYRVASPGFCPKNGTATIDPIWPLEIRPRLVVISCPGPCSPPCVTVAAAPIGVGPPEPRSYPVTIKAADYSGAAVSGALVEIDPATPSSRTIKTDASGQIVIGLPTGMHSLRVNSPWFRQWKGFAEVQGTEEMVIAKLAIAGTDDPEIIVGPSGPDTLLYVQEPKLIAPEPLKTLAPAEVTVRKHE